MRLVLDSKEVDGVTGEHGQTKVDKQQTNADWVLLGQNEQIESDEHGEEGHALHAHRDEHWVPESHDVIHLGKAVGQKNGEETEGVKNGTNDE